MFNRKTRSAAAAMLAFSLVTTGASFVPSASMNTLTAHADDAYRQYDFIIDSSASPIYNGGYKYVVQNNKSYYTSITARNNSISILGAMKGIKLAGVTKNLSINGNVTNVDVDTSLLNDNDYLKTIKGVLQKVPNLDTINNQQLFIKDKYGKIININTNVSDDVKKVISACNAEDNEAITKGMKKYIRAEANKAIEGRTTDYEKVRALHDWVISKVDYDPDTKDEEKHIFKYYTATDWAVFMNPEGYAICDGYARALTLLLQCAGFEAYYEGFGGHGATMVKLYGEFYHIDATWDDKGNGAKSYRNFLRGDKEYTNHTIPTSKADDEIEIKDGNELLYILRFPSSLYKLPDTPLNQIRCNESFFDLNGDNMVTFDDAYYVYDVLDGYDTLDENKRERVDFNRDGKIDYNDAAAVYAEVMSILQQ